MIKADAQQKRIIAILTKGDKDFKRELVINQTGDNNKGSTNDLSFYQANQIIQQLGGTPVRNKWTSFDANIKSHLAVLSQLQNMQWHFYNEASKRHFADMARFGSWLQTKAPVKKPLVDMSPEEVSKTIYALENIQRKEVKKTSMQQHRG